MSDEAEAILDRYWDLLLPVKVVDITNRCGVCIRPLAESLCQNFSGIASVDQDTGKHVIYCNPYESANRQRFTIAHELGHHVLGHTMYGDRYIDNFKDDIYQPDENAANSFAAEIIMPSRAVLRLAGSKGFKTEYDLAVLFDVSIDAVHWKLVNLGIIDNGR